LSAREVSREGDRRFGWGGGCLRTNHNASHCEKFLGKRGIPWKEYEFLLMQSDKDAQFKKKDKICLLLINQY